MVCSSAPARTFATHGHATSLNQFSSRTAHGFSIRRVEQDSNYKTKIVLWGSPFAPLTDSADHLSGLQAVRERTLASGRTRQIALSPPFEMLGARASINVCTGVNLISGSQWSDGVDDARAAFGSMKSGAKKLSLPFHSVLISI
jgi:hypothetical protein